MRDPIPYVIYEHRRTKTSPDRAIHYNATTQGLYAYLDPTNEVLVLAKNSSPQITAFESAIRAEAHFANHKTRYNLC